MLHDFCPKKCSAWSHLWNLVTAFSKMSMSASVLSINKGENLLYLRVFIKSRSYNEIKKQDANL